MSPAIVADGLTKRYGKTIALDGLDLQVEEGTVLGLLGPNGAGKTTAVRILTTLLRPDAGRALVAGVDVAADPAEVRRRIGLAGQFAAVDLALTGRENLVMFGRLHRLGRRQAARRADRLLERFDLAAAADRAVKTYSGGMMRRLDLAAALVATPQVLFMDEPSTGLDPAARLALWAIIDELVRGGLTLLLTTQYLEEVDRLADTIAVVDTGRVIAEGTAAQLKARVGGDRLDVALLDPDQTEPATEALRRLGLAEPLVPLGAGVLGVPAAGGATAVAQVVRALDHAGVAITDITVHRPTLDDVFMHVTGHGVGPAGASPPGESAQAGQVPPW